MYLAAGDVIELAFEHHLLDLREVVGEDLALEVVVLVLDDAGQDAVDVLVVKQTVLVVVGDVDVGLANHLLVDFGQAETALSERDVGAETVGDGGVDERALERFVVGVDFLVGGRIHDEHAHGLAHLRGGETYAFTIIRLKNTITLKRNQLFKRLSQDISF